MAEICLKHDLTICADEIHCDLIFSGHRHTPIASLDPEIADRTITLMAPSKTFNLAGLHSSFAVIPNAALRERFIAQRLDLVHRMIGILGYTATVAAYRDGQPWLDELLIYLEANRDVVAEFVDAHLPGVRMYKPEGTYLAWLDCRDVPIPGGDPYTFFLDQARVGLNNGANFGKPGEGKSPVGCRLNRLHDVIGLLEQLELHQLTCDQFLRFLRLLNTWTGDQSVHRRLSGCIVSNVAVDVGDKRVNCHMVTCR